jgi:hypothetical protein
MKCGTVARAAAADGKSHSGPVKAIPRGSISNSSENIGDPNNRPRGPKAKCAPQVADLHIVLAPSASAAEAPQLTAAKNAAGTEPKLCAEDLRELVEVFRILNRWYEEQAQ